ncbi:MAG: radical SAM protein [Nitrospirae bacterium YQR-1]
MLRLSEFLHDSSSGKLYKEMKGIVCIWNLTNKCNLTCKHCYSSANEELQSTMSIETIAGVLPQLKESGVKMVILSGGEPLLRQDIFDIAGIMRKSGLNLTLSTNGLLINENIIDKIKDSFQYVGISIDGEPGVHDHFRGRFGAYDSSIRAIGLCMEAGINVGVRFTLSNLTYRSLPHIFRLVEEMKIPKLYISHIVTSGRGKDLMLPKRQEYLSSVRLTINKTIEYFKEGGITKIVTGNNDSEAVVFLNTVQEQLPEVYPILLQSLTHWGGNQAGVKLMNINHRGEVRPDPFFVHNCGNLHENSLTSIWNSNGLLTMLREKPRKVKGKCMNCEYLAICNGNCRARAYAFYGTYDAEDPGCLI